MQSIQKFFGLGFIVSLIGFMFALPIDTRMVQAQLLPLPSPPTFTILPPVSSDYNLPPLPPPLPGSAPFYQTSASPSFVFSKNLAKGYDSLTMDVLTLQHILFNQGFLPLLPTGYFGSLTEQAVMKFQAEHGIAQTGFVGALTRQALNAFWSR